MRTPPLDRNYEIWLYVALAVLLALVCTPWYAGPAIAAGMGIIHYTIF